MKYTKDQRLDIGRRIYDNEITRYEAAAQYGIHSSTARDYMRMYRDENQLPPKPHIQPIHRVTKKDLLIQPRTESEPYNLEAYESMSKDELIHELVKARITEARLKKGYEVKGDGSLLRYSSKNTK